MIVRCLLVDDSDAFLAAATRLLEAQGVEIVAHATCREEAILLAGALRPDVALVDVELGDEDGFAVARELQARLPGTRVALISAHSPDDLPSLRLDTRTVTFLPKTGLGASAIADLMT
jgi:two-component system, NarL family, nitrate/nitrite response regulator NarL